MTTIAKPTTEVAKKLNNSVATVLGANTLLGFEKAFLIATAVSELKSLLTKEYMAPIMALQGNKLGFKTDKDKTGGYPEDVVKNCLIEAVLIGLQPFGNQFNIIAGQMYPTKEGLGHLLNNYEGLKQYDIVCNITKISQDRTSASVDADITWTINGEKKEKRVPIPIKIDQYASVDSIIGKATRKGRAWLLSTISGIEITDGDVQDTEAKVVGTTITKENKEEERLRIMINEAPTLGALNALVKGKELSSAMQEIFDVKKEELINKEI